VDLVANVDDRLGEGLVPLAHGAGEHRADVACAAGRLVVTGGLVDELARSAAPEVVRAGGLREEVVQDLAVELKSDLLGEDLGELNLSVDAVVSVQILRELRRPASAELAGRCGDGDGLDLDVDLGDDRRGRRTEVRLEDRDGDRGAGGALNVECRGERVADAEGIRAGRSEAEVGQRGVGLHDHEDVGGRERGRREGAGAGVPSAELVEATDVENAVATLVSLARNREARDGRSGREERDVLDERLIHGGGERTSGDDEVLEGSAALDSSRHLGVEAHEATVGARGEDEGGRVPTE